MYACLSTRLRLLQALGSRVHLPQGGDDMTACPPVLWADRWRVLQKACHPLCDLHPPEAWLSAAGPWPPSFHLCPSYWYAQHARLPCPLVYDQTISWHWSPWGKPSFNFAPSTITCGQPAGSALHYERNSKFEGLAKNSHLDLTYHYRIFTSIIWNLIIKTKK